jgi:excisionase family DNA binding protein
MNFKKNAPGTQTNPRDNVFFLNQVQREWLSTEEAAYFLSITPNALRILVHRDQIRAYKFGRRLRFNLDECRLLFARKGA